MRPMKPMRPLRSNLGGERKGSRDEYEVKDLLEDGISQGVSARDFDEYTLEEFVESAVEGNTIVYIRDSHILDESQIEDIAEAGKRHVAFL
jgi:hypothetical protein